MARSVLAFALGLVLHAAVAQAQSCSSLSAWTVPNGFSVQLYYDGQVKNARSLAISKNSKLNGPVITYVSAMNFGGVSQAITALVDTTGRGGADYAQVILPADVLDVSMPNGIAWYGGALYIAALKPDTWFRLYRIKNVDSFAINQKSATLTDLELLRDDLPIDFWHGWKYIRFDAKGNLYIPIGANANIAFMNGTDVTNKPQWPGLIEPNPTGISNLFQKAAGYPKYRFDSIYRFKPPYTGGLPGPKAGAPPEQIAVGVRNTVGFDWHPSFGLYFTDNGRDNIGGTDTTFTNNAPDCEINYFGQTLPKAPTKPVHFGYPFCHTGPNTNGDLTFHPYVRPAGVGAQIPDPNTNQGEAGMKCNGPNLQFTPAIQAAGPHMAPLGMRFYRWFKQANFPSSFDKTAFVALHGSWNRYDPAGPIGAKVMNLVLQSPASVRSYTSFFSGGVPGDKGAPDGPNPKPLVAQGFTGRPVDVEELPDGSILISDDFGGRVFRVSYCTGPWYGSNANYGIGRCGSVQRGSDGGEGGGGGGDDKHRRRAARKLSGAGGVGGARRLADGGGGGGDNGGGLSLPADTSACSVRSAGDVSTPYRHCAKIDTTGRGTWLTVAWTFLSAPGDPSRVRFKTAFVWDDADAVYGTGWVSHALNPGNGEAEMIGLYALISRLAPGGAGASIADFKITSFSPADWPPTPDGTFNDKANTLKASSAGGALVQQAEWILPKRSVQITLAMGDTNPTTGAISRHWYHPGLTIPFVASEVDAPIPATTRVANPRTVTAAPNTGGSTLLPTSAGGCTVNGVTYDHCADLDAGTTSQSAPVTHYYSVSGGTVTAAFKVTFSGIPTGWFAWLYNSGAPGTMVGSSANAAFIRGGSGVATPNTLARVLQGYIPTAWLASTFFSGATATSLGGNQVLLTVSFPFPSGQSSILIQHAAGPYSGTNPATMDGMSQHVVLRPQKLCLSSSGQLALPSDCGTC